MTTECQKELILEVTNFHFIWPSMARSYTTLTLRKGLLVLQCAIHRELIVLHALSKHGKEVMSSNPPELRDFLRCPCDTIDHFRILTAGLDLA